LRTTSQLKLVVELNVGQGVLVHSAAESTNDEAVRASSNAADQVLTTQLWLNPRLSIVNAVSVGKLFNVEGVFFSALFLLFLLESLNLGVRGSVLPIVDAIVGGNDDMCCVHGYVLGLNANVLGLDWTANSVAQLDHPGVFDDVRVAQLRNKNAVVSMGLNCKQALHVLNGLFIDLCVPEGDAHVVALWLSECKHNGLVEVCPDIIRLNVRKQDIRVYGQHNPQSKALPSN